MTNTRRHSEDYEVRVTSATQAYAQYWFASLAEVRMALGAEGIEVTDHQGVEKDSSGNTVSWVRHLGGSTFV